MTKRACKFTTTTTLERERERGTQVGGMCVWARGAALWWESLVRLDEVGLDEFE